MTPFGRALVLVGAILVLAGLALMFLPRLPFLGRLPGDIVIKRENFTFYFPLTTSILLSLLLTLILSLFGRK